MSRVFAFIFARGGSKGLPGKNLLPLGGIPLIGHSIRIAQQVPQIEKVFVSTEDPEIGRVAKDYGAYTINRPPELAGDTSPEWDAWKHAVEYLENRADNFDIFLSLPATSPLRSVKDVSAALDALEAQTDAVITVTPASRSPYFNMVSREPNGTCQILSPSSGFSRRQDAPEVFDITTVAYVLRVEYLRTSSKLFEGRIKSVVVPKERAIDIDDQWDFLFAEALYRRTNHDA